MKKGISTYSGDNLNHIAFPLGGIGAGMFCVQGSGSLGNFSIRNAPNVNFEPNIFSAIYVKKGRTETARLVEGQVPYYKIFDGATGNEEGMGNGLTGKNYGLPRFRTNDFTANFPFANLKFIDDELPISASLCAFSPFLPLDAASSSNPVASLEYTFKNTSNEEIEAVYYINAFNFMNLDKNSENPDTAEDGRVYAANKGFILNQPDMEKIPDAKGDFYVMIDDESAQVNIDWFDGGWFDVLTMQWNDIKAGKVKTAQQAENTSPGGSIAVPFSLKGNEEKTITIKFAWYVPITSLRFGKDEDEPCCCCSDKAKNGKTTHKPWYSEQHKDVKEVMSWFENNYDMLYATSKKFSDALYSSTLPEVAMDAVTSNLTILKSPTVLRQTDGRIWAWEGCCDTNGCCTGSCTHVWNYAQAMPHLFPELERSLRQTEFNECQNEEGHQRFRASLPIRPAGHDFPAASDGQLGGIMKIYREWKIKGDTQWVTSYWDKMITSLEYCIRTWDKTEEGVLKEPHHNTYDIEFWGADGMCSSFYLGALKATSVIGEALDKDVKRYVELYKKGREYVETKLFNGEFFIQEVEWETLDSKLDLTKEKASCVELLLKEGPKYQYGKGCLSDGVLGAWLAKMCGLGDIIDPEKVKSHLLAIYKYNFKKSLLSHDNPQRPGFAVGDEGGLLLCTWPNGEKPSLPFVYSDEVWTGIEYQVATHLISIGYMDEGMKIVSALRDRYDGTKRNPFNEYECGHWYARAMASYSLLQAITGVRYDALEKTLYLSTKNRSDFTVFLSTENGYGTVTVKNGKAQLNVVQGAIDVVKTIIE